MDKQSEIHFGTDGWRAIIGKDFTNNNLVRVADAAATVFWQRAIEAGYSKSKPATIIIGHDCRQDAHNYAALASQVVASHGFRVELTDKYCPTPTLCWSVAHNKDAVGGLILTSSHNPAEYLGVKLRMVDGGASPKEFTDKVEAALKDTPTNARGSYTEVDLMTQYLASLKQLVDTDAISKAKLKVVVDPLYGAGRHYLANLMQEIGIEVCEINNDDDPTFDGLHPEPIPPWINRGLAKVKELEYDAVFINDGDADRIGAGTSSGDFVNPHRIFTLLVDHMRNDRGQKGRVVSTFTASSMLWRMCKRLGLEYSATPVGFKWIYEEMCKGDVMIGGEESGGIGLPGHVKERDGLLMALLLCEMMAQRKKSLAQLLEEMFEQIGQMEFERRGLQVTDKQMQNFKDEIVTNYAPKTFGNKTVESIDRRDGIKLCLANDEWVMMRPSGTEPLIRIYAEAQTYGDVDMLLKEAEKLICA